MTETVKCPKCGTAVESGASFGMVTCAQCGEFILLGDDASGPPIEMMTPTAPPAPLDFTFQMPLQDELSSPGSSSKTSSKVLDTHGGFKINRDLPGPHELIESAENISSGTIADFSVAPNKPEEPEAAEGFRDVVDFGNSVQPSLGFGALVYDVEISGIDTAEIREELRDCLRDKRLGLDISKVLSQVKNGELKLLELNPVKASVFLGRVRHLPFKIKWTSRQLVKAAVIFFLMTALFAFALPQKARAGDWARHEANLKTYASKIRSMQEDIQTLIIKKNQNHDPDERDQILKDIIKKNAELQKTYSDFKEEKEHIRYEHPEQGDNTERKYRHVKLKSLEELENEVGIDGQLSRLKRKVGDTYPEAQPSAGPTPKTTPKN